MASHQARQAAVRDYRRVGETIVNFVGYRQLRQRQEHRNNQQIRLHPHGCRVRHAVQLILGRAANPVRTRHARRDKHHEAERHGVARRQIRALKHERAVRRLPDRVALARSAHNRPAGRQFRHPEQRLQLTPRRRILEGAIDRHRLPGHIAPRRMGRSRGVQGDREGLTVRLAVGISPAVGDRDGHAEFGEARARLAFRGRPGEGTGRGVEQGSRRRAAHRIREALRGDVQIGRRHREGQRRELVRAPVADRAQHGRVVDRIDRHVDCHMVETSQAVGDLDQKTVAAVPVGGRRVADRRRRARSRHGGRAVRGRGQQRPRQTAHQLRPVRLAGRQRRLRPSGRRVVLVHRHAHRGRRGYERRDPVPRQHRILRQGHRHAVARARSGFDAGHGPARAGERPRACGERRSD